MTIQEALDNVLRASAIVEEHQKSFEAVREALNHAVQLCTLAKSNAARAMLEQRNQRVHYRGRYWHAYSPSGTPILENFDCNSLDISSDSR